MTKLLHADLTNGVVDSALKFAKIFDKSEEGFAKGGLARLPCSCHCGCQPAAQIRPLQ